MEQNQGFEFIKEKIKERPFNKKKLFRKTIVTAAMAVIFGLIACFTFLVLEPVFSNWLHPQDEISSIEIPADTNEVLPGDMLVNEESVLEQKEEVLNNLKNEMQLQVSDYQQLYKNIYEMTKKLQPAMVTVTGVTQDIDWFNDPYETKGQTTGFLFAQNNKELLILVAQAELKKKEELLITFADGSQIAGIIKGTDANSGMAVLAVNKEEVSKQTLEAIDFIVLGNSRTSGLLASPVIAMGKPLGNQASVVYGMITSKDTVLSMTDGNFKLLTTDIYGSTDATGILVDFSGHVVGIIYQNANSKTAGNLISAIGITELKPVLERMSNGIENSYLGIKGTDVPEEIQTSLNVPKGAYVTGIVMDSPAMAAGIQSGDVLTNIGDIEIQTFSDFTKAISSFAVGEQVEIHLMRQRQQEYRNVKLKVTVKLLK